MAFWHEKIILWSRKLSEVYSETTGFLTGQIICIQVVVGVNGSSENQESEALAGLQVDLGKFEFNLHMIDTIGLRMVYFNRVIIHTVFNIFIELDRTRVRLEHHYFLVSGDEKRNPNPFINVFINVRISQHPYNGFSKIGNVIIRRHGFPVETSHSEKQK